MTRRTFILIALIASACARTQLKQPTPTADGIQLQISDQLYFGRNIPSGGVVSDDDWQKFLADVVTPRFPQGLTVFRSEGQWRDAKGFIDREQGFVLFLLHHGDAQAEKSVREIMTEYKTRFKQDAVLRVRNTVGVQFW